MLQHDQDGRDHAPLSGVVLCCTSILPEQRTQLACVALQMGATHKLDLTSDVTHLIVGSIDTPKYKYVARERQDIKVLRAEWLEAVRASWIQGGDTDVTALEHEYKLPALFNLHICVTGFDDLAQRTAIQDAVAANGGTYHGDLTKNVSHLIAAQPSGRKYEYAGQWRIQLISLDWLHQSIDRGMALDESLYHPLMPPEQRGKGAITNRKAPSPVIGKRPRSADQLAEVGDPGRRKLRRSASSRLGNQSGSLWADIGDDKIQQKQAGAPHSRGGQVTVSDFKNEHNEDVVAKKQDSFATRMQQKSKSDTGRSTYGTPLFAEISPPPQFFLHGFDESKRSVLSSVLSTNGGQIVSEEEMRSRAVKSPPTEDVTVVVPHSWEVASDVSFGLAAFEHLVSEAIALPSDQVVTEFWIEQCLFHQCILNPVETPLCRPFKHIPISGFGKLKICPTSFSGCDLLHLSKVAKLMGAKYDEYLRKDTSVLICHDSCANPGKLRYALENEIPVVSSSWFYDCVEQGTLLSFGDYTLSTSRHSQRQSQPCFYHPTTNPRPQSISEHHTKGDRDRPASRGPPHQGRLALARTTSHSATSVRAQPSSSSVQEQESFNTANESLGVLQDVSDSKQNSQKGNAELSISTGNTGQRTQQKSEITAKSKSLTFDTLSSRNFTPPHVGLDDNQALEPTAESDQALPTHPGKADTEGSASSHSLVRNADNLSNALAAVLAQRKKTASFQLQSKSFVSEAQSSGSITTLKRRGKLGRAPSNGSHGISHNHSLGERSAPVDDQRESASEPVNDNRVFDDELESGSGRFAARREELEKSMFRPSQALSYEDPDAAAVKEELMKRVNAGSSLGFHNDDNAGQAKAQGERVESIGTVKDATVTDDRKRRGTRKK